MDLTYRVSALARISPTIFMLLRISPTLFDGSDRASACKTEGKTDVSPKTAPHPAERIGLVYRRHTLPHTFKCGKAVETLVFQRRSWSHNADKYLVQRRHPFRISATSVRLISR